MRCLETFRSREKATEKQHLLAEKGIKSKVFVDPLESMYPALSDCHDVALVVAMEVSERAEEVLHLAAKQEKRAS